VPFLLEFFTGYTIFGAGVSFAFISFGAILTVAFVELELLDMLDLMLFCTGFVLCGAEGVVF